MQIIERPDSVSWDEIHDVLWKAHAENRRMGINMSHYQWPSEKIRDFIGKTGVVLVAIKDGKVIGTTAIKESFKSSWYARGKYAYLCFDCVLPDYRGLGVFKLLDSKREEIAIQQGYNVFVFDTHLNNTHRQDIAKKNGYRKVGLFWAKDHYSVIMVKWVEKPYPSIIYCRLRYILSMSKVHLKRWIVGIKGFLYWI